MAQAPKKTRGSKKNQELNEEWMYRDTRSFQQKAADFLKEPQQMALTIVTLAAVGWYTADYAEFVLILCGILLWWALKQTEWCPVKMPIQCRLPDPNQLHPGTGKPEPAEGIFHIGLDFDSGKEIWLTNSDCRQHFLVLGTTGAGKPLAASSVVHTPKGWVRIGELREGDLATMPDGTSAPVKAVIPQGERTIQKVTFEDGRSARPTPDHHWTVFVNGSGPVVADTSQLRTLLDRGADVRIPLPKASEMPAAHLGRDPYEIGMAFAGQSAKRLQRSRSDSVESGLQEGIRKSVMVNAGVMTANRLESMINVKAICSLAAPKWSEVQAIASGSISQRHAFLAGLLDGSVEFSWRRNGAVSLVMPKEDSAELVADVVRSLGGAASVSGRAVAIKHKELTGADLSGGLRLIDVADDGEEEAVCILVDHPDHLFITDDYVVTHNTETLLGFAANAVSWGSGFLFCDGKGDVSLFAKVYALCRRFGREDDLLVLNFMTGNQDVGGGGGKILSNTMNPFATGASDNLTQMVVGLMDDVGGDGAMWKGRATAMFTGVMRALAHLRDVGVIDLNIAEIRDHLALKKIIDLADPAKYDLPQHIRKSIKSYLTSLPGFQEDKGYKQAQTTLDQHGYLEMQFTKILGSLADVYGHIFKTPYGEVDMMDVVLNRRILVIMLPALEKSGDEIANLGKIVVATLKGMMGSTLGSTVEGSWAEVVENRPTNSPSPFLTILDEVGYYTVEGMALMAAQARSLGFSMIYASQDIPAMKRLNEKEAASIIANTNTKIFMRTEEAQETGELFVKSAGEALRAQVQEFEGKAGNVGLGFNAAMAARVEKVARGNFLDLKQQSEGEFHVVFKESIVRGKSFYADPASSVDVKKLKLRPNHFLKIPRPDREELVLAINAEDIIGNLTNPEFFAKLKQMANEAVAKIPEAVEAKDEVAIAATICDRMIAQNRKPIEAGCAAVADVVQAAKGASAALKAAAKMVKKKGEGEGKKKPSGDVGFDGGFGDDLADSFPSVDELNGAMGFDEADGDDELALLDKAKGRVDPKTMHGATVGDTSVVDMAERIESSDAMMKALSALDFGPDDKDEEEIDKAIESALADGLGDTFDDFDTATEDISRVSTAIDKVIEPTKPTEADSSGDGEKGGGSSAKGVGSTGGFDDDGEFVEDFLESLLNDED